MAFDDDDSPTAAVAVPGGPSSQAAAAAAGDDDHDDEMPDFKLFSSMLQGKKGISGKTIRRGEKDFEAHGTRAQDGALESSRQAMEDVLSYTRVHKRDAWVRAWYFPDRLPSVLPAAGAGGPYDDDNLRQRPVVVEHEKGSWMKDMGRVVPAAADPEGVARLWLLPEEALYLVERGTLDLWWPDRPFEELLPGTAAPTATTSATAPDTDGQQDDYSVGTPLSLEAAYSILIGDEGQPGKVSLPKYQVFGHLKRGGFHILRASSSTPAPPPAVPAPESSEGLWSWLASLVTPGPGRPEPWGPLVRPGLYRAYAPVYRQLAIMPRHKPVADPQPAPAEGDHPFHVFYHVWKSSGAPFSKKAPPAPDFRIAVADTADSGVPDLQQLDGLFASGEAPYDPPHRNPAWQGPGRMYQRLKHGHRSVLVAVVDRGLVNFIRFGEGAFGDERLSERFDTPMRGGRKGGGGRGRGRGGRGGRGRGRR